MFKYHNPSNIIFKTGILADKQELKKLLTEEQIGTII